MTRSKDHMQDRRSNNPKRRKKSVGKHGGREVQFEMKILATFNRDQLGRQSMEGQLIREADPGKLINNKEEWIQPTEDLPYSKIVFIEKADVHQQFAGAKVLYHTRPYVTAS